MVDKVDIEEMERACVEDQTEAPLPGRNTGGYTGSSAVVCRSVDRMHASCWSFPLARLALLFSAKSKMSAKVITCIRTAEWCMAARVGHKVRSVKISVSSQQSDQMVLRAIGTLAG